MICCVTTQSQEFRLHRNEQKNHDIILIKISEKLQK